MRKPSHNEVKKMFSVALKVLIKAAMENHIYTWDGSIKKQSKGGVIGSDLTGELGVFFMLVWTSIFIDRVKYATLDIPDWEMHMLHMLIDKLTIFLSDFCVLTVIQNLSFNSSKSCMSNQDDHFQYYALLIYLSISLSALFLK